MPLKPLQMLQHKTRLRPELLLRWIQQTQQRWTGCFSWGLLTDVPGRTGGLIINNWDFMGFHGISLGFHGDFMGFHGISLGFHGIYWDFMGFHGISWDFIGISLGFHGISWDFIGISWWFHGDFMGFHGIKIGIWIWQFQTGFHGDTIRDILKPGLVN